jgi:hypothetical protein
MATRILRVDEIRPLNGGGSSGIVFANAGTPAPVSVTLSGPVIVSGSLQIGSAAATAISRLEQGSTTLTVSTGDSTNATFRWTRTGSRYQGDIIGSVDPTAAAAAQTVIRVTGLPGIASNFAATTDVHGSGARQGDANDPRPMFLEAVAASQNLNISFLADDTTLNQYHIRCEYSAN